jgi:N-acylneuraminate cytidylyltransferase
MVTRVIVSTDDDEISEVAEGCGAQVLCRPAELAGDIATSESALLHVLDHLMEEEEYEPDLVVFLQATSPMRRVNDIDAAVARLTEEGADSLFSASRMHGFVWRRTNDDLQSISYDYRDRPRRQDVGEDLLENGSIYVFKPWVLRETGSRLGGKIAVFEMDPLCSFQVDEPSDIGLIERVLGIAPGKKPAPDFCRARLLVLDFDGVMTDDRVAVGQDGTESVVCHRGDGLGIERLRSTGVEVLVLSKETNPVVAVRCAKLGIECHQGLDDKLPRLEVLAAERGLRPEQVAYVGNDVNDLACVRWAGVGVAVADARRELRLAADWVTARRGGDGAIREVCDRIMEAKDVEHA